MKSKEELLKELESIDHKGYPAYKSLAGTYQFPGYILGIDHVQGDPFASPSAVHMEMPMERTGIPKEYYQSRTTAIALQDYLLREFAHAISRYSFQEKGSGKSGLIAVSRCTQEVLERSACEIRNNQLILRFHVGFPAFGRTIHAEGLRQILFETLPKTVEQTLHYENMNQKKLQRAVWLAEDQACLREILKKKKLVSFAANGAILPRQSGVSDLPMKQAVPFQSPKTLEQTIVLPHYGRITGMGIPQGVTLIVGGGYHGKSTLLEALQAGVYNHIAGDGREFVITDDTACKVRAEDGRSVRNVDISMFIKNLPDKRDTTSFSSVDASGSTSQAASVIECLEAGSQVLMMDEDTSATNFMVRDEFMQQVIARDQEPITPYLERIRGLYENAGISTILVAGSSGAFFHAADTVIQMDHYEPEDITERVKALCRGQRAPRMDAADFIIPDFRKRIVPNVGNHEQERQKTKTHGTKTLSVNHEELDLRGIEQLTDQEQVAALAKILVYAKDKLFSGTISYQDCIHKIKNEIEQYGWEHISGAYISAGLAKPRIQEISACLNRFRFSEVTDLAAGSDTRQERKTGFERRGKRR